MKRIVILLTLAILATLAFAGVADAAVCLHQGGETVCTDHKEFSPFKTPPPRPHSITDGLIYGWVEDYAYFYDRPEPGARHVSTASTGFFYGPATDTATDGRGNVWYKVWGHWLPARYFHQIEVSDFAGVEVNRQPVRPFGWILRPFQPRPEPGAAAVAGTPEMERYEFVEVYDAVVGPDGVLYYNVGEKGWVHYRYLTLIKVRERPDGVEPGDYWVDVDLTQQTIAAYEGDRMVYAALISSGLDRWPTRTGLNQVWERRLSAPMSGGTVGDDYYRIEGVAHTLYFDGEISLHNAFWHDDFGRQKSHGCVNLAPRVAEWIYYWSAEGPNDLWVWSHHSSQMEFTRGY